MSHIQQVEKLDGVGILKCVLLHGQALLRHRRLLLSFSRFFLPLLLHQVPLLLPLPKVL
jgi:hypothetical protein